MTKSSSTGLSGTLDWCAHGTTNDLLYTVPTESYLRGVPVTDVDEQVMFTLIVPR